MHLVCVNKCTCMYNVCTQTEWEREREIQRERERESEKIKKRMKKVRKSTHHPWKYMCVWVYIHVCIHTNTHTHTEHNFIHTKNKNKSIYINQRSSQTINSNSTFKDTDMELNKVTTTYQIIFALKIKTRTLLRHLKSPEEDVKSETTVE